MWRLGSTIVLIVVAATLPGWPLVGLFILHAFFFGGFEIILIGVAVDALFGSVVTVWPWHTLAALAALYGAAFIRPRLLL